MTAGPSRNGNSSLSPATAGSPPAKESSQTSVLILVVLVIGIFFILPLLVVAAQYSMAGNAAKYPVVAAAAQQTDDETIVVTYQGGEGARSVVGMTVNVTSSSGHKEEKVAGSRNGTVPLPAGETFVFTGPYSGKDYVVGTVWFSNGWEQVIVDTRL